MIELSMVSFIYFNSISLWVLLIEEILVLVNIITELNIPSINPEISHQFGNFHLIQATKKVYSIIYIDNSD